MVDFDNKIILSLSPAIDFRLFDVELFINLMFVESLYEKYKAYFETNLRKLKSNQIEVRFDIRDE